MALQDIRKGREGSPTTLGGVGTLTAFIDQGSEFSGKLSFKDTVRIDGKFEGEITSQNTLIVGESGVIHANIKSEIVIVSGEIRGDINAKQQITLHKTARVSGNLRTKIFAVEEGAQLNGKVQMGGAAGAEAGDKKDKPDKLVNLRDSSPSRTSS